MVRFDTSLISSDPDRLKALDDYGVRDLTADAGFDGIVMLARTLCATPTALVTFVENDHQWFAARSGFGPMQTPLSHSICVHTLAVQGPLIIPDLAKDSRTSANALVTEAPHLRFYAGIPLRTGEGAALGALCVLDDTARPSGLSEEQTEGLKTLAAQIMMQLELRRQLVAGRSEADSRRPRPYA